MTDNASAEWRKTTLGDFAPFVYGKGLPKAKRNPNGDVPIYGSNGVIGFHDEALTAGPTIIIGRKGTIGAVHYSPVPCWPIDTTFFVEDDDAELARFRYYAMSVLNLKEMNSDTAVPGLNRGSAHALEMLVPSESDQRRVSAALGALDDKIELNARMNETLDETARALFRAWFVDFVPVRAKMSGAWRRGESPPGLPAALYDAFPDDMADSELGEIPAGWGKTTLGDFAPFVYGKGLPKAKRNQNGDVPIYGSNGIIGFHDKALTNGPTIIIGRKGTIGAIHYSPVPCWPIDTTFFVESDSSELARFRYYAMSVLNLKDMNSDTAVPGLNRASAHALEMLVPSESACAAIAAFGEYAAECDSRIRANTAESRSLAAIRDTLLPKLLSGEISA